MRVFQPSPTALGRERGRQLSSIVTVLSPEAAATLQGFAQAASLDHHSVAAALEGRCRSTTATGATAATVGGLAAAAPWAGGAERATVSGFSSSRCPRPCRYCAGRSACRSALSSQCHLIHVSYVSIPATATVGCLADATGAT